MYILTLLNAIIYTNILISFIRFFVTYYNCYFAIWILHSINTNAYIHTYNASYEIVTVQFLYPLFISSIGFKQLLAVSFMLHA